MLVVPAPIKFNETPTLHGKRGRKKNHVKNFALQPNNRRFDQNVTPDNQIKNKCRNHWNTNKKQ